MYEECASGIVQGLFNGYNGTTLSIMLGKLILTCLGTILAYGQTGSGKTFTMTGATENYKHRGLIPRALNQVFRMAMDRPELAVTVRVSYLDIYNETMIDLLASLGSSREEHDGNLTVVEDKFTGTLTWAFLSLKHVPGSTIVKGLTTHIATNEEEALNLLFEGETNRSISEHELNKKSTRSHCIFTIHVESRSRVESSERVIFAKLNLVDLAGSERLSKTGTDGATLKEAMCKGESAF